MTETFCWILKCFALNLVFEEYRVHPTNCWCFRIRSVTNCAVWLPAKQKQAKPTVLYDSSPAMDVLLAWWTGLQNFNSLWYRELGGIYCLLKTDAFNLHKNSKFTYLLLQPFCDFLLFCLEPQLVKLCTYHYLMEICHNPTWRAMGTHGLS